MKDTKAIALAEEVVTPADTDLDAVALVYDYVTSHVTYDWDKAKTVESDYLPDIDEALRSGKLIWKRHARSRPARIQPTLLMTLLWKFSVMTDSVNRLSQDPHRFQDFFLRVLRAKSKAKCPLRAFPVLRHRHQNM